MRVTYYREKQFDFQLGSAATYCTPGSPVWTTCSERGSASTRVQVCSLQMLEMPEGPREGQDHMSTARYQAQYQRTRHLKPGTEWKQTR